MAIKLVISGCCGRMGQTIAHRALQDPAFSLAGAFEAAGHQAVGHDYSTVLGRPSLVGVTVLDDPRKAMAQGDVVIEFTAPEPTVAHVQLAQELRKPMVIGTTGLSHEQAAVLNSAAQTIPVLASPNMSLGVNVLFELARVAAQRLGMSFDVEVIESHHRQKKDAPSGTAKRLAEVLAAARQQPVSAIPVHAVRAGDIIGEHTAILAGQSERIELTHRAQSRDVFALGALRAAQFLVKQKPGLYDMSHVLAGSGVR